MDEASPSKTVLVSYKMYAELISLQSPLEKDSECHP